jgi:glutathione S-transferase
MTTTLYYAPGACSLSPHIALLEAQLPFELDAVDFKTRTTKSGKDFLHVNPKGYVPALGLDDGQVLTEGAVIVQYIADKKPEANLAPAPGTFERFRLQEWLHFIATELQKGFGPINHPKSNDELRQVFKERLTARFQFLAKSLSGKDYLLGSRFSVADGYAYYTLRSWQKLVGPEFGESSVLRAYFARVGSRESVRAALKAEGLT